MKRIFLILTLFIAFFLPATSASAEENRLHSISVEKADTGYNIILGTDTVSKVVKKTPTDNEIEMDITGIKASDAVSVLYKGDSNIQGPIIENTAPNKLKIHIHADNIKDSTIMIDPADGETSIVGESVPMDKLLWVVFVLSLFAVIFKVSQAVTEDTGKELQRKDFKEREIRLYKKYRDEMYTTPVINSNNNYAMRKILKKIDRRIDERLTTVIK